LPECYVERLDALKNYYYELSDMRFDLVSIREGLSSPDSGHPTSEQASLSALIDDIKAAIVLLECAEDKISCRGRRRNTIEATSEYAHHTSGEQQTTNLGVMVGILSPVRQLNQHVSFISLNAG
jgi:hypothetical protein